MNPTRKHWRLEVTWEDSYVKTGRWHDIETVLAERGKVLCHSVGFVLADDERGIVLASSVHGSEATGIVMIPAGCVVKRKELKPCR